jgi:hypothetical protein
MNDRITQGMEQGPIEVKPNAFHYPTCLREDCKISRKHVHFADWRAHQTQEEGEDPAPWLPKQ